MTNQTEYLQLQEISRDRWQSFCGAFSREHHGWLASLWEVATEILTADRTTMPDRAAVLAKEQLFQEISMQVKDGKVEFMVTVGKDTQELSFLIQDAVRLYNEKLGNKHKGLRIDNGAGSSTLVEFRAAAKPEELDGLAESELWDDGNTRDKTSD